MGHKHVGTEHILLGLIKEQGIAAEVLKKAGLTFDEVREEVILIVGHRDKGEKEPVAAKEKAQRALLRFARKLMSTVECPEEHIPELCNFLSTPFCLELFRHIVQPAFNQFKKDHGS